MIRRRRRRRDRPSFGEVVGGPHPAQSTSEGMTGSLGMDDIRRSILGRVLTWFPILGGSWGFQNSKNGAWGGRGAGGPRGPGARKGSTTETFGALGWV